MTLKRIGIKLLKITGIFLGVIIVLFTVFHFWFIHQAKGLLEDTVYKKSNGKIKLKIEKLRYNYFNRRMSIREAVFLNTDTATASTAYRFAVKEIKLELKALLPLVFNNKLLIDSLFLKSPDIRVTTLRFPKDSLKLKKEEISIPYEMGRIYKSIQDALNVLQVNRFQIDDARFTLINKIEPEQLPLTISNINFQIDNLNVDSTISVENRKILFSDNIILRSINQNIVFPDGRHRLAFKSFRINLKRKLVEFDSCTVEATRTDSSASSFKVFFDALLLTNIDFDTLYKSDVIKADSVYCINPKFNLDVHFESKKKNINSPSKLEKIIKQLTGELQLNSVIVANADFNIKTTKDGKPSTFNFSNNNFEMQGLNVQQDDSRPIKIEGFVMAIRNYENFIKDSTYSIKFDSILFKDNQLTLSNFLFNKLEKGKIVNTFSMPQFKLEGLFWDELVFEKKLKARQATMLEPYINYTATATSTKKSGQQNIFQSLGILKEFMDLELLNVINGTIDLKLKQNIRLWLEKASLSIQSQSLLASKKISGIKNSLSNLNVGKGSIMAGKVNIALLNFFFSGDKGKLIAGAITVNDKENKISLGFKDISVDKLLVDEITGNISAEGINWQKADISLFDIKSKPSEIGSIIEIKNVIGLQTSFKGTFLGKSISTHLNKLSLAGLEKRPGKKLLLNGLNAEGHSLAVKDNNLDVSINNYHIADNKSSYFKEVKFNIKSRKIETNGTIPVLKVIPHIQPLLIGEIALDNILLEKPVINISFLNDSNDIDIPTSAIPPIVINEIKIKEPRINIIQHTDKGKLTLNWNGANKNADFLQINDIRVSDKGAVTVKNTRVFLADLLLTNAAGKSYNSGNGTIAAEINNISLAKNEDKKLNWSATLSSLNIKDLRFDSLGKAQGNIIINSAEINEFKIGNTTMKNWQQLASTNSLFQLKNFTGKYSTPSLKLNWFNAGFDRSSRIFSLDSFFYSPALEKDSFLTTRKYQTDYIKLSTKAMFVGPFDFEKYVKDSTLNISKIQIEEMFFYDYKDKNLPFNSGIIKPLPVNMIKKIPIRLAIDTVMLKNSLVEYTEVNEKTNLAGLIPVTRLAVTLLNVKNYNLNRSDSLTIKATGYLLDTAWTQLRVKESYTDSLGGFLMTLRTKPVDLVVLNNALIPLASIKLISGKFDTIEMRAIGREYLSLGEMKMFYKDLKIQVLKNGAETKKTFLTKLSTFIANTFIIKTNNSSRIGNVFFIRQRDKSAINYLIKIALSGMTSSVGAKNNKKMIRKYRKELVQKTLPPFEQDYK